MPAVNEVLVKVATTKKLYEARSLQRIYQAYKSYKAEKPNLASSLTFLSVKKHGCVRKRENE